MAPVRFHSLIVIKQAGEFAVPRNIAMIAAAEYHLLFGLLALQNGLINQGQLVAAFQAWTLDKSRSLADHLVGRGDLDAPRRSVLEALALVHLQAHGGDVQKSLAAVSAGKSTQESLARIGGPEVEATLTRAGVNPDAGTERSLADIDRTFTYSVGTSTSDDQRFRVLRPHARGGLGAVYVALDAELNREVALKQILNHHADDPTSRTRFLLEAEITGGLEHPGIVPVYGLGTDGAGRPYYAMRFIRGESLKDVIAAFHADPEMQDDPGRRSLALRKLLRRFVDVCNAIEYAHTRGVIHRDIKPANIIVGKYGETLVVDWGLAKAMGKAEPGLPSDERTLRPSSASGSAETLPGSAMGTPAYMSPEQAAGDLHRLGPRSDVYSLGATLYCLLTMKPPFAGDDLGAVLRAVGKGDFPLPRSADPSIDRTLEAVCLKAMATTPEDRYASPRALADDIERWMADEPVTAWRESIGRRAQRWTRRHRTLVVSSVAVLILGAAGSAGIATVLADKNRELDATNSELTNKNRILDAKDAENRAVLTFFQTHVLAVARPEDQDGGLGINATVRAAIDAAESRIGKSFATQPMVEASIRDTLGESYVILGEPALAIHQLERSVALRRGELGPDHADTLHSAINLARAYQDAGRLAEAMTLYSETLPRCKARLGLDHADTLNAMNDLGSAYRVAGRLAEAVEILEDTLKRRKIKVGPRDPDTLVSINNLATTYQDAGELDRALPLLAETLKAQETVRGPNHPDTLIAMNNLARAYQGAGQPDQALPLYQEALKRQRAQIGPDHPDTLISMSNLATLYRTVGRHGEALLLQQEALQRSKARLGPDHPDTLRAMSNLGNTYRAAGRLAEALPVLEEALNRRRTKLGREHPETLRSTNALARAYLANRPAQAESLAREALAILEKQRPDDWFTFDTRSLLGGGLLGQQKYADAEPLLLQGYEGMKARESKIPVYARSIVAEAGSRIVELYDRWGKKAKADEWRKRLSTTAQVGLPPVQQS